MPPDHYLDAIGHDARRFAELTGPSLDTPIAFLGDWRVRDLVEHLGWVYGRVAASVSGETPPDRADAPAGDGINEWFGARLDDLLRALASGSPDDPAQSFFGQVTRGWFVRRMAHETAVHRWDAAAAVSDEPADIDSDLAADGIDEYSEVGLRSAARRGVEYPAATLHLHRTDGPGEWMFARGADGNPIVTHEHGKGDAAVRGPASPLLLWIWGRPVDGLDIFGDPAVASAWQSLAP